MAKDQIRGFSRARSEEQKKENASIKIREEFSNYTVEEQRKVLEQICADFGYNLAENPPPFAVVGKTTNLV